MGWNGTAGVIAAALFLATPATAGDDLFEVVSDGYVLLHEEAYLDFEGCEHDKAYKVGPYIFLCSSYDYSYEHRNVLLMVRRGATSLPASGYLCPEDEECVSGMIMRAR